MKKLIAIILCVCFVLCLTACNKDNTTSDIASDNSQITSTENQTSDLSNLNEPTESSKPAESINPDESSKPTTKPETTKPITSTHTHNYSKSTCTEPAKCSCGAIEGEALGHDYSKATCTEAKKCSRCGVTEGSALGHKWQKATCQAPKTCSVCKLTEGVVQNHNYNGGFCITCRKQDPDATNPIKSLKFKTSYTAISEISETEIETVTFYFENTNTCDINVNSYSSEEGVPNLYIDYNGKRYFHLGGGGPTLVCELHEDKIIIKDTNMLNETQYMTIKLNPNGSLVIIQDDILDMQNQVLKP